MRKPYAPKSIFLIAGCSFRSSMLSSDCVACDQSEQARQRSDQWHFHEKRSSMRWGPSPRSPPTQRGARRYGGRGCAQPAPAAGRAAYVPIALLRCCRSHASLVIAPYHAAQAQILIAQGISRSSIIINLRYSREEHVAWCLEGERHTASSSRVVGDRKQGGVIEQM